MFWYTSSYYSVCSSHNTIKHPHVLRYIHRVAITYMYPPTATAKLICRCSLALPDPLRTGTYRLEIIIDKRLCVEVWQRETNAHAHVKKNLHYMQSSPINHSIVFTSCFTRMTHHADVLHRDARDKAKYSCHVI